MKIKELVPIKENPSDFEAVSRKIIDIFREEIYLPLLMELGAPQTVLKNSLEDLIDAIASSRISFYRGRFTGRFNAKISKALKSLGAAWSRKASAWEIHESRLPPDVSNAIRASESRFAQITRRLSERLSKLVPEEIAEKVRVAPIFDMALWETNEKFKDSVRSITVPPVLTSERRARIAEDYTNNLRLYIRDWTKKEIVSLREKIEASTFKGTRYDAMVGEIQRSYGVGVNKAKFLARQETHLLLSTFKQVRYQEAGVNEYRWQCVKMPHDTSPREHTLGNVRYYHGQLDGKIFSWDNPPVVDSNGNRKHPGTDWNCRCFPIPLVKF